MQNVPMDLPPAFRYSRMLSTLAAWLSCRAWSKSAMAAGLRVRARCVFLWLRSIDSRSWSCSSTFIPRSAHIFL
jgi:hypothetical protein